MPTQRTTRAQADSLAEVATPSPARRGRPPKQRAPEAALPRARAAATDDEAEARRDDGGSDADDDRAADEGLDDEPTALGQGERAMECCFWQAATRLEPTTDSLVDRRFVPLHGHAPSSGRESIASARAREAGYDSHSASIRAEVASLVAQTNAHVFDGVVNFVRAHPPVNGRVPLAIVATRCNAHDEAHALAQLGAHVRRSGLSRFVAHLRAVECASVHTTVRALATALLPAAAGAAYDGRSYGRPNGGASHDLAILARWYAAASAASGAREPVAVFIADAELLSAEALDDLVYALSTASAALPVALIAGVATSADALIASLPRTALARVQTTRFRLQPALSALDETVRRVCLGVGGTPAVATAVAMPLPSGTAPRQQPPPPPPPPPRRPLGVQPSARAFGQLCDHFLTETLSLASVEHTLCLGALRHFTTEPLAFLAALAPRDAADCARLAASLDPYHLACARALPSVRRALGEAAAAAGTSDAAAAAAAAAPSDAALRALIGSWLWRLHGHAAAFRAALLALHAGLAALAAVAAVTAGEGEVASAAADGAATSARPCLKPMRWQLSLREMYAAALEDVTGVERLLGHLQAELAPQARPPSLATPYAGVAAPAAAAAVPAALAGGRGPAGLLAFADAVVAALDAAEAADTACARAFAGARAALRAARAQAQALLDGSCDDAGGTDAAAPLVGPAPAAPPPPPSRAQQQYWSAAKRRLVALQPAAAAAGAQVQPSGAARAAAEAHAALGQAVCLLARGCLRPLRAFPLGEAASGAPSSEARALRAWTSPRVREVVRDGLLAFALAAPEAASAPRAVVASTPAPAAAAPAPTTPAAASAVSVAMRETRYAPRGREPLTLERATRAAGNTVTTVALAGTAPLAALRAAPLAAATTAIAPARAGAAPPARAEPLARERLELPDMLLAHCHFAHAEQRALNLADWYGDFAHRVAQVAAGEGVHTILARIDPSAKAGGPAAKRKASKSGLQRRGDAKLRRAGHLPVADKAAAARKAGRQPAADADDEDDDDDGDGGVVAQAAADPALLARFIGAVGSIHAHGLVRASTRHPGHVIKMVFDGAAADI